MSKYLIPLSFLLSFHTLSAQKVLEKYKAEALRLSKTFEDENIARLRHHSSFEFSITRQGLPVVSQKDTVVFIALASNSEVTVRTFYNDHSEILSYDLNAERNRHKPHTKYCGHYKSTNIFYSDAQLCAYLFQLNTQGNIASLTTEKQFKDPRYLTGQLFHGEHPTVKRKIEFIIPGEMEVELMEMNFDGYEITRRITTRNNKTIYTFLLENTDAFSDDEKSPGFRHYLPHLLIISKSYTYDGKKQRLLSSTDDLYQWYKSLTSQLKTDYGSLEEQVRQLTENKTDELEKAKAIYYWVQDNIKYIAFEDGLAAFKPEEAQAVFNKKYGDCKGMANLTKAMLEVAGISSARLTWLGTNKIPYTYDIPSLAVDNHMVCTAELNGQRYILDATDKYNMLGYNSEHIQGKEMMIEQGEHYSIERIATEPIEKSKVLHKMTFNVDNDRLTGSGSSTLHGEYKKRTLYAVNFIPEDDREEYLQHLVSGMAPADNFEITEYSELDRDTPLTVNYECFAENVNRFDDELYISLEYRKDLKQEKISDERKVPYTFGRKIYYHVAAELPLPAGYQVDYLPTPLKISADRYDFDLTYAVKDNKVIYEKQLKIFDPVIPVSAFEDWNAAIKTLEKFYNDQIILKRQ